MGDQLMGEFPDKVFDVDCTADGKELCDQNGVKGYPSIKYGDPTDLQDYNGGRDFDALKKFAEESLGPTCGPKNLDLCDDATKKKYEAFLAMSVGKLEGRIRNSQKAVKEDVPFMNKVLASMTKGKSEL